MNTPNEQSLRKQLETITAATHRIQSMLSGQTDDEGVPMIPEPDTATRIAKALQDKWNIGNYDPYVTGPSIERVAELIRKFLP